MNIELRSIQIHERMSEETTAFNATLYIENYKVGYASNRGTGGPTDYRLENYHDQKSKELLQQAEDYCSRLAPIDLGEVGKLPMDLENFIDQLVDQH